MKRFLTLCALVLFMVGCKSIEKTQSKKKDSSQSSKSGKVDSSANTVTQETDAHTKVGNVDLQIKGTGRKGKWENDGKSKGPVSDLIKEAGKVSDATGSDVRLIIGDFDMKYSSRDSNRFIDYQAENAESEKSSTQESAKDVDKVSMFPGFTVGLLILLLLLFSLMFLDGYLNHGSITGRVFGFIKKLFSKK